MQKKINRRISAWLDDITFNGILYNLSRPTRKRGDSEGGGSRVSLK